MPRTKPDDDEPDGEFQDAAETLRHIADAIDGGGMQLARLEIEVPGRAHDPQRAERIKELLLVCPSVRVISNYTGRVSRINMEWPAE